MSLIYGLYARVSTADQLDGMSIEAQIKALREWATAHGFGVREFVDAGHSAWTEDLRKRPAFLEMLDAARAREINGIAVTHLDRFSRKVLVTLSTLGELGQLDVGFVSLENTAFDFTRPADHLLLTVLGAFAEYYSAELSRKIRRGLAARANKGLSLGVLEFGYCNGACLECKTKDPPCPNWGKTGGAIVLDPRDALGVQLAFESYHDRDKSFDDVADILNAAGFRSRTRNGRVPFNQYSVDVMLQNISYTGIVSFQGKEIPGQHPAIIPRELFDEVQDIRIERRNKRLVTRGHTTYLLAGLLICAGCGRLMRSFYHYSKKSPIRWLYYRCGTNELHHVACPHASAWINENELAPQMAELIARCELPADWLEQLNAMLAENGKPKTNGDTRARLREKLTRLADLYELGDMKKTEYVAKRDAIKAQLAQAKPTEAQTIINAAGIINSMRSAWELANAGERRDMLRATFDEVRCDPSRRAIVAVKPKEAFRLLFKQMGMKEQGGVFEVDPAPRT